MLPPTATSSVLKRYAPGLRTEPDGDEADPVAGGQQDGRQRHRAGEVDEHPGREGPESRESPPGIPAEALTGGADVGRKQLGEIGGEGPEAADGKKAVERHEPKERIERRNLRAGEQCRSNAADY